ncbi:MAG: ferritin [Pseudomonadota bacterium]
MIKPAIQEALNNQINAEYYSAFLYLSMSAWAEREGLPGMANWFKIQFQEEQFHADRFFGYLLERGGHVTLTAIEGPPSSWSSPLEAFEATLVHERHVTSLIDALASLAMDERDHATLAFLQWFITEQVEEEAAADAIVAQLKLVGDSGHGRLMLDREMAARVFTPPVVP